MDAGTDLSPPQKNHLEVLWHGKPREASPCSIKVSNAAAPGWLRGAESLHPWSWGRRGGAVSPRSVTRRLLFPAALRSVLTADRRVALRGPPGPRLMFGASLPTPAAGTPICAAPALCCCREDCPAPCAPSRGVVSAGTTWVCPPVPARSHCTLPAPTHGVTPAPRTPAPRTPTSEQHQAQSRCLAPPNLPSAHRGWGSPPAPVLRPAKPPGVLGREGEAAPPSPPALSPVPSRLASPQAPAA